MRGGGSFARVNARSARMSAGETRPTKKDSSSGGAAKKSHPYDSRIPGSRGATEPTVPAEFVVGDEPRQEL